MTRIRVDDGVELDVQDLGAGPTVVLLAGFGLDHSLWDRQVRVLAGAGFRVVCVDQRGHGASDKPLGGYELERLGQDLIDVVTHMGISQATIVGHSFGGQVAFRAAAAAPHLVARLVLVGSNGVRASRSVGFPFGALPSAMLPALLMAEENERVASRRKGLSSAFASPPDPDVLDMLLRVSLEMPSWSGSACYVSMLEGDLSSDVVNVRQPVLQVIGSTDPVHSAKGAAWLQTRLPDATLVELPRCGHFPMLEAPDQLEGALLTFLRQ